MEYNTLRAVGEPIYTGFITREMLIDDAGSGDLTREMIEQRIKDLYVYTVPPPPQDRYGIYEKLLLSRYDQYLPNGVEEEIPAQKRVLRMTVI